MPSMGRKQMTEFQGTSDIRRNATVDMYACSTINTIMAVAMTARKLSLNVEHKPSSVPRTLAGHTLDR